ncbi:MAG: hypothetical protein ACXW1W_10815 [Methylococcaceae bacterium]
MKKYRLLLLIAGTVVLLFSQYKIVMPLVYDVIKSDLFLVDSEDKASQLPISNNLTEIAFLHCNNHIKSELGADASVTFQEKPINAWSLGNYEYIINGEASITNSTSEVSTKKYACRIIYDNGDNAEGAEDFENWSIVGLSGLDN